jgi:hypothetical protein
MTTAVTNVWPVLLLAVLAEADMAIQEDKRSGKHDGVYSAIMWQGTKTSKSTSNTQPQTWLFRLDSDMLGIRFIIGDL